MRGVHWVPVAALLAGATPCAAVEVPSAWWISHLRAELGSEEQVRLRGAQGVTVLARPGVDSTGLHARETAGSAPPGPIAWDAIERVEVGRNAAGRGALWGALAGTAVAIVYFASVDTPEQEDAPLATPAAMAGGAVIGMGIGSLTTRWVPLYPPPDAAHRPRAQ